MAALNRAESEDLRDVWRLIEHIQKFGFDPNVDDNTSQQIAKRLEISKRRIRSLLSLKGYYSK